MTETETAVPTGPANSVAVAARPSSSTTPVEVTVSRARAGRSAAMKTELVAMLTSAIALLILSVALPASLIDKYNPRKAPKLP